MALIQVSEILYLTHGCLFACLSSNCFSSIRKKVMHWPVKKRELRWRHMSHTCYKPTEVMISMMGMEIP